MKQPIHIIIIGVLLCTFLPLRLSAQPAKGEAPAGDSLRISLLTCGAGDAIYTLFGHTAIRCENLTRGTDVVYNYGVFDFGSDAFVLRFALGDTNYCLEKTSTRYFCQAYYYNGRNVWQQVLDLSAAEKQRLVRLLEENYRPENRVYLYNFFYDNCSTRPRDKVEEALQGRLAYAEADSAGVTYRDLIEKYSEGYPWSRLGMNLALGSEADKPISRRAMEFVPFLLQADFGQAQIADSVSGARPLVLQEGWLVKALPTTSPRGDGLTPNFCAWLLFGVTLALTIYGIRRGKSVWGWDVLLFSLAGLAGCVLAFLMFFSKHPCMNPNYLIFVFHPLHLVCLPWVICREKRRRISFYLMANLVVLTLFMVLWGVLPQEIPSAVVPLALCLWARSANNLILSKIKRR